MPENETRVKTRSRSTAKGKLTPSVSRDIEEAREAEAEAAYTTLNIPPLEQDDGSGLDPFVRNATEVSLWKQLRVFAAHPMVEGAEKGLLNYAAAVHLGTTYFGASFAAAAPPAVFIGCLVAVAQAYTQWYYVGREAAGLPAFVEFEGDEEAKLSQAQTILHYLLPLLSAIGEGVATGYSASFVAPSAAATVIAAMRLTKVGYTDSLQAMWNVEAANGIKPEDQTQLAELFGIGPLSTVMTKIGVPSFIHTFFPCMQTVLHATAVKAAFKTVAELIGKGSISPSYQALLMPLVIFSAFGEAVAQRRDMQTLRTAFNAMGYDVDVIGDAVSRLAEKYSPEGLNDFLAGLWRNIANGEGIEEFASTLGLPLYQTAGLSKVVGNAGMFVKAMPKLPEHINIQNTKNSTQLTLALVGSILGTAAGIVQWNGRGEVIKKTQQEAFVDPNNPSQPIDPCEPSGHLVRRTPSKAKNPEFQPDGAHYAPAPEYPIYLRTVTTKGFNRLAENLAQQNGLEVPTIFKVVNEQTSAKYHVLGFDQNGDFAIHAVDNDADLSLEQIKFPKRQWLKSDIPARNGQEDISGPRKYLVADPAFRAALQAKELHIPPGAFSGTGVQWGPSAVAASTAARSTVTHGWNRAKACVTGAEPPQPFQAQPEEKSEAAIQAEQYHGRTRAGGIRPGMSRASLD